MAIDGDLGLDQLLARGVDVGGISERQIPAQLLLDDDPRSGIAQGAKVVGVNFDRTGAKELLDAAAYGGIQGPAEQGVGSGISQGLFLLLGVEALLASGAAQGEQGNYVCLG